MNKTRNEFRSRWGYHPCNYELFTTLKLLYCRYWQTVYDFHTWHRWWRKDEQNRIGPEPKYCTKFVENVTWFKPTIIHGDIGFKVYPKKLVDKGIIELYQRAKTPNSTAVEIFDAETINKILELHSDLPQCFPE